MCNFWKVVNVKNNDCVGVFYDCSMAEEFINYQLTLGNVYILVCY